MGMTTLLVILLAWAFGLNQVASQIGAHAMAPLHLLLFLPFIELGVHLFHTRRLPLSRQRLEHLTHHPWRLIRDIWQWEWHALIVWGAVAEDEPVRGLDFPRGHSHQAHLLTGSRTCKVLLRKNLICCCISLRTQPVVDEVDIPPDCATLVDSTATRFPSTRHERLHCIHSTAFEAHTAHRSAVLTAQSGTRCHCSRPPDAIGRDKRLYPLSAG